MIKLPSRCLAAILSLILVSVGFAQGADKKPLTNADVIKLVKAELPESTVLLAIQSSPHAFDTTTDGLIQLKQAGITSKVIEAMMQPTAPVASTSAPAPAPDMSTVPPGAPAARPGTPVAMVMPNMPMVVGRSEIWGSKQTRIEADRVFLVDAQSRTELKFTRPNTRRRMLYSVQTFAVINGTKARIRAQNASPCFEMILPNNEEVTSMVALALLGVRPNGTREILISAGWISMSQGLPKDRNIALSALKTADQTNAPEGYEIYQIRPEQPLKPGEYALMVSKPAGGELGVGSSAQANYNFYELGVD